MREEYRSDIRLDERYRDTDTGFEGVAKAISFYRNGCERVELRVMVSNIPVEHWFDAPQLVRIDAEAKVLGFANGEGR
jgi:hypothetical protein